MNRKRFLEALAILPLTGAAMKINDLNKMAESFGNIEKMPVLFLGHGSPMNAIEENEFVTGFRTVGKTLPKPRVILAISAHWETKGTFVTAMEHPPTIHDFGGFPKALFDFQYPAPGSPGFAKETKELIKKTNVGLDPNWGLDHGTWSVVKHLYPLADIPVVQMSIDYTQNAQYHYDLAKELYSLRSKGVLIIGSGNLVHNLGMLAWNKINTSDFAYDWALEASTKMKQFILANDYNSLIHFQSQGKAFNLAIPSPEHYLPMLYCMALKDEKENISIFNDKAVAGSLTMTSIRIGNG